MNSKQPQAPKGSQPKSAFGKGGGMPQAPPAASFQNAFATPVPLRDAPASSPWKSAFGAVNTGSPLGSAANATTPPATAPAVSTASGSSGGGPCTPKSSPFTSTPASPNSAVQRSPAAAGGKGPFTSSGETQQSPAASAFAGAFVANSSTAPQAPSSPPHKSAFGGSGPTQQAPPAATFQRVFVGGNQAGQAPSAPAVKSAFGSSSGAAVQVPQPKSAFLNTQRGPKSDFPASTSQSILGNLPNSEVKSEEKEPQPGASKSANAGFTSKSAFGGDKNGAQASAPQNPFGQLVSSAGGSVLGDAPGKATSSAVWGGGFSVAQMGKASGGGSILGDISQKPQTAGSFSFPPVTPPTKNAKTAATANNTNPATSIFAKPAPAVPPAATHADPAAPDSATDNGTGDTWRCKVCGKVKDLKGPHLDGKNTVRSDCWPCAKKQTFLRGAAKVAAEASPAKPAENPKPAASADAKATPHASPKVQSLFKRPVIPAESVEGNCLLRETPVPATQGSDSVAPPTSAPTSGGDAVWRCSVCNKTKDLKGPHLNGKSSVRSDCWPCAKKQTFLRGGSGGEGKALAPPTAPETNAKSTATSAPASLSAFTAPTIPQSGPEEMKKLLPVGKSEEPKASSAPLATLGAVTAPKTSPSKSTPAAAAAGVATAPGVWRCGVCGKVKELKGPHLNGKTSVRSDCWPCAKKQTFHLDSSEDGGKKVSSPLSDADKAAPVPTGGGTGPAPTPVEKKDSVAAPVAAAATAPASPASKSAFGGPSRGTAEKASSALPSAPAHTAAKPAEEKKASEAKPSLVEEAGATVAPSASERPTPDKGTSVEETDATTSKPPTTPPPPPPPSITKEEFEEMLQSTRDGVSHDLKDFMEAQFAAMKASMSAVTKDTADLVQAQETRAENAVVKASKSAQTAVIDEVDKAADRSTEAIEKAIRTAKDEIVAQVREDLRADLVEFREQLFSELQIVLLDHFKRLVDREAAESSEYFPRPTDGLRAQSAGAVSHLSNAFRK